MTPVYKSAQDILAVYQELANAQAQAQAQSASQSAAIKPEYKKSVQVLAMYQRRVGTLRTDS